MLDLITAFLAGGLFSVLDVSLLAVIIRLLFFQGKSEENGGGYSFIIFLMMTKLGLIFGGLAVLIYYFEPVIIPFSIGAVVGLILSLIAVGVWSRSQKNRTTTSA